MKHPSGHRLAPEVAAWLADVARPVDRTGLSAWRPALDGTVVLGVGAATRGSRELLELGRRFVEFAVEEMGVRTVAIGASESGAMGLDAAGRGIGSADEAVAALGSWEYHVREVVDLVTWLRGHNEWAPADEQVRLVGTDPVRGAPSVKALGAYLRAAAPDLLPGVRDSLADLLDREPDRKALPTRVRDDVVALHERLVADEARVVAESSPSAYAEALRHAGALARVAEVACAARVPDPGSDAEAEALAPTSRPVLRARLASHALVTAAEQTPGGSPAVLFWGHDDQVRVGDPTTVGRHLRAALGDGYYAVAGLFGHGGAAVMRRRVFRPIHPRPTTLRLPALSDTVEADLAAVLGGEVEHVVDLRAAHDGDVPAAVSDWADAPTRLRRLGPFIDSTASRTRTTVVPADEYDALAHVPTVSPARIR